MFTAEIEFPGAGRFSREWLESNPQKLQELLSHCQGQPRCLCKPEGLPLYVARKNTFYLARMPYSGPTHAPWCASYDPDPSQCGRGVYDRQALSERADGTVAVKLDVSLLMRGASAVTPPSNPPEAAQPKSQKSAMGLKGLLHLLCEESRFNRWSPRMQGRRHYRQWHKYFMEAAHKIIVRREPLAKLMYIPEPFLAAQAIEIDQRRQKAFQEKSRSGSGALRRLLVVAQLRSITEGPNGQGLQLAHVPDHFAVWLDQRQLNAVRRAVEFACVEWPMLSPHTHIIVALTMHRSPKGWWSADEVAAMVMTSDYLPCQSLFEMRLLRDLVEQRRYFIKPLNYDGDPSNYPNAALTDTTAGECAMEIVVGEGADASKRRLRADELKEQGKPCWIWMAEEQERPPPLPLAQRHRPTQINPEPKQDSTTPRTRTTPESRTAPNEQMSFGALAEAPTTHVTATPPANDSQLPASAQPP